ncbi:nascent polypeptide-associated complex protein [Candidatus Pacearchaeota archaeon]|nr:nascent polypeptide-associated complex protein [Candidatus Pacearchaeota archaeon]
MFGNVDPKKIQAMMKQMGINQQEIPAERVIIEKADGRIVIDNPNVQKIIMQGQASWQITGEAREESAGIREEDIKLVAEKTGKSMHQAKKALEETNDIAEAIMKLSE